MPTIREVKERFEDSLLTIEGVFEVTVTDVNDKESIQVHVVKKTDELIKQLPDQLDGYPVTILVIEKTSK